MSTATGCVALGCVSSAIPSGSGETGSPPPKSRGLSAIVASTSEEEGLHDDPLPHSFGEEEEGLHLTPLPRTAGGYFGGRGTGPPPHSIGMYFVFPAFNGELTFGGVNTVHHTEVRTCHLSWQLN